MEEIPAEPKTVVKENLRREAKKAALEQLKGRWTNPVLATLTFFAVFVVAEIPIFSCIRKIQKGLENFWTGYFFTIVILIIAIPIMHFCYILFMADFQKQSGKITYSTFMEKFDFWKTSMKVYWYFILQYIIAYLIVVAVLLIVSAVIGNNEGNVVITLGGFLLMVVAIVFFIRYMLSLMPYFAIMAEDPEMKVRDAMKLSKKISKGNIGKIFVFFLSFFGWAVLAVFTVGIGTLWLLPYFTLAFYNYCLSLEAEYKMKLNEPATSTTAEQ